MPTVELVHAIKAPAQAVFAVIANPVRLVEWEPGAARVDLIPGQSVAPGGLFLVQRKPPVGHFLEHEEITECRRPVAARGGRFHYRTLVPDGTYRQSVCYDVLSDVSGVSRVAVTWDWDELDGVSGREEKKLRQAILEGLQKLEGIVSANR